MVAGFSDPAAPAATIPPVDAIGGPVGTMIRLMILAVLVYALWQMLAILYGVPFPF